MSLFGNNASSDIRKGYSMKEKKDILQYIANRHAYSEVKGRRFWVEFAVSGKTTRTWQSLKEVYIKRILPDLRNPYYELSLEDIKKFSSGSYTNVDAKNIEWLKNEKVKNIFTESSGSCIPNTTVTEQKDNHQNKVVPPGVCALDSDTDIELVSVRARASPTQEATQEIESSIALPGTSSEDSVEESLANLPGAINTRLNSEDKARVTLRLSPDIMSERETQFSPNKFKETFLLLDSEDSSDIKSQNIMDKCSRQEANLFGFSTGKPTLISNNTKRRRDVRDSKGYKNDFKPTSSNAIAFSTPSKHQTFKKFREPSGTETSTDCQSEDSTDSEGQYIPLRSGGDQRGKGKGQKMYCSLNGNLIQLYQSKHRKCSERQKIYTHFQDNCKHGKQMKKQKSCYIDDEPKTALKQSQALVFNRNEKIDNMNQQVLNYWKMKYISEKKRSNDIFRLLSMEKNTPFVNNSSEQKLPIENPTITISNNRPMEPNTQEKVKSTVSKTNLDYQLLNEKPSVIQNSNLATSTAKPSTAAKDFNQNEKRDLLMVKYAKNSSVDAVTKSGLDNNVILIDTQKANILFDLLRKLTDSKIPTDNSQLDSKSENMKSTQVQNEESVELINVENYQLKTQNGTVSKTYTNVQNDGKLELPHKTLIETQKDEVDDIFISLDREGSSSCISKNELDSKQTDKVADEAQDGEVTKSLISVQSSEAQPADNTKSRGVRNEKSMKLQNADKYQLRTRNPKISQTPKNKENIGKLELPNKMLTKTQKDEIDEIFFSLDQEDGSSSTSKRNDSTEDTDVVKNIRDKENKIFEQILSEDAHEDLNINRQIFSSLEVKMLLNENSHEGDSLLNPKSLENENNSEFLPRRRGRKSKTSPKNVTVSDTVRRSYRIQPSQDASLSNLEEKKKETVLNVSVEQNGINAKHNTKSQGTPLGQGYLAKRKFNDNNKRKIENDSDIDEEARFKINPKFFKQASSKTRNKKSRKILRHTIKMVSSSSESDEMESFRFTLPEFSIDTSRLNKRQTENNRTNWFTDGPTTSSQNHNRFNKLFNSNYPTKYKYHITNNCAVDNISKETKDNFGNPSVDLNPFQQQCDSLQQSDNKMYEKYAEKNYNYYCNPNLATDDIINDSCEESEEIPLQNGLFDFIKKRKTSKCLALSINHVLENDHRLGSESNVNLALPLMEQDIDLYNIDKNNFLSNIEQNCTQASSVTIDVTGNNSPKEKVKNCINDVPIMKFSKKVSVDQDAHEISATESLSPCIDRFFPNLSQNSMLESPSKVSDDMPEVDTLTKYSTKQADSHNETDTFFSDEDNYLDPPQDSLRNNNISLFDSSPTQYSELDVMLKVKELHKVGPEISPDDVENSNSKIEPKTVIINSGHGDEILLTNAKTLVSEDIQKSVYLDQWKDIMTEDESD